MVWALALAPTANESATLKSSDGEGVLAGFNPFRSARVITAISTVGKVAAANAVAVRFFAYGRRTAPAGGDVAFPRCIKPTDWRSDVIAPGQQPAFMGCCDAGKDD